MEVGVRTETQKTQHALEVAASWLRSLERDVQWAELEVDKAHPARQLDKMALVATARRGVQAVREILKHLPEVSGE
jgi:hypothetical protein